MLISTINKKVIHNLKLLIRKCVYNKQLKNRMNCIISPPISPKLRKRILLQNKFLSQLHSVHHYLALKKKKRNRSNCIIFYRGKYIGVNKILNFSRSCLQFFLAVPSSRSFINIKLYSTGSATLGLRTNC